VEPEVLERLLDVQEQDTAIRLLDNRKETLPEARRLASANGHLAELDADIAIARRQRDDVARDQARLEGEIELLDGKIGREEKRLFSGSVANPKELTSLQAEVKMLRDQRARLEDQLLEAMVQREGADDTLGKLEGERATTRAECAELTDSVGGMVGDIDAERAQRAERRTDLASGVPDDLLALYERLRAQKSGVGAAALVAGSCQGCHTQLPAREVERLRSEGGLQRCESCRRILVVL
jgi:predicted  nucleic acid-binding Zn-ribbon protein